MRGRTYPGRLTPEEWLRLPLKERLLIVDRAEADLLDMWRSCSKNRCRRAHACLGEKGCKGRAWEADFKHPDFGQPHFKSRFTVPKHVLLPSAIVMQLPFLRQTPTAETLVQHCAAEAGAKAAAAARRAFHLQRRRGAQGRASA